MGLQVGMCIDGLDECLSEQCCVQMLENLQLGHIVLSRLAVHFPVDIDTTLVLGEWVIVEQGADGRWMMVDG